MDMSLRDELVALDTVDQEVRLELATTGALFDGYDPRMEAIHRSNAARLGEILSARGWPGIRLVGEQGASAAWRIAQHAIGNPPFMRMCRDLLAHAVSLGDAPPWQLAFLEDRICVFEGRLQRFGTQLRRGPSGMEPCPIQDPDGIEDRREGAGLPPLKEVIDRACQQMEPPPSDLELKVAEELRWRRLVGWLG